MVQSYTKKFSYGVLASGLALMGCKGPAGQNGQPGQNGQSGTPPTFTIDAINCGGYLNGANNLVNIIGLYLSISNTSANPINCSLFGTASTTVEGICTSDPSLTLHTNPMPVFPFSANSTNNVLYGGCLYSGSTSDTDLSMNFVVTCTDNHGLTTQQQYSPPACTPV